MQSDKLVASFQKMFGGSTVQCLRLSVRLHSTVQLNCTAVASFHTTSKVWGEAAPSEWGKFDPKLVKVINCFNEQGLFNPKVESTNWKNKAFIT